VGEGGRATEMVQIFDREVAARHFTRARSDADPLGQRRGGVG
jgi:hypothetical protein